MSTTADPSSSERNIAVHNRGRLLQVLGMWFGIAAAIGNTIAAGIVRTPGDVAQQLPHPWLFLCVWVLGGAYALIGASSMAELGAMIPRSGGQYNFSRRGIGEYAGFLVGWSDWLSTCGTNAAVAIVIGEYSVALVNILHKHVPALSAFVRSLDEHDRTMLIKLIAVSILLLFAILQWRGVKWGSGTQLIDQWPGRLREARQLLDRRAGLVEEPGEGPDRRRKCRIARRRRREQRVVVANERLQL